MTSRHKKILAFSAGILAFTAFLILGVVLFVATKQPWAAAFWGLIWGIVVVITVVAFIGFLREGRPDRLAGDHRVVEPPRRELPPAADRRSPWPVEWLAPALADTFADTPYVVRTNGHSILVHADLADARWQHIATLHGLKQSFVARLTPVRPGVVKRTDETHRLEWQANIARLGGIIEITSGRQFGRTRRVDYGLGFDGFKKRVDFDFTTSEINEPVREILRQSGWRSALDAETKGALIVGGLGASALVIVPIALAIGHLVGA